MKGEESLYSAWRSDWETPQALFDEWNERFHFETDVCASPENAKCPRYFTKEQNGLKQKWTGVCWCNPPYGRDIGEWVKKARESDAVTVMLLPARTDTKWFHDLIYRHGGVETYFLRGRVKFVGGNVNAPFPSMICVFNAKDDTK